MSPVAGGWEWFEPDDRDGGEGNGSDPALAIAFARCFADADGRRVLQHLRALTGGRALAPAASDAALRHLEGQRALVLYIEALTARGAGARLPGRFADPADGPGPPAPRSDAAEP